MPSPLKDLKPSPKCSVTWPENVAVAFGQHDSVSLALYGCADEVGVSAVPATVTP